MPFKQQNCIKRYISSLTHESLKKLHTYSLSKNMYTIQIWFLILIKLLYFGYVY